jgi:hypothetical protein
MGTVSVMLRGFDASINTNARVRIARTETAIMAAREALIGYSTTHGRLPRPAISLYDGRERESCITDRECIGVIPWVTLGISGIDSWGQKLHYIVSSDYTRSPIIVGHAKATRHISNNGDATQHKFDEKGCAVNEQCSPAIIFSIGTNTRNLTPHGGGYLGFGKNDTRQKNNNTENIDFFEQPTEHTNFRYTEKFDEQMIWLPIKLLHLRMYAAGVLY